MLQDINTQPISSTQHASRNHENFFITEEATPELWTQLEELLDPNIFIAQDEVTMTLLREFPNCRIAFLVRKEDNVLISALSAVFTKEFAYGNFFVTRKEYRSFGYGMDLFAHYNDEIKTIDCPMIGKARVAMLEKYCKGPFKAVPLSEIFNVCPQSKKELLSMFPTNNNNFDVVSTDKLTADQFESLLAYDHKVTGTDRTTFLKKFVPMVLGAVILDSQGTVIGYAATRPCRRTPDKYQIAPLWAEDENAAGALLGFLVDKIEADVPFIVQCRKEYRGGSYILEKAELNKIKTASVAYLCDFGQKFRKPNFQDRINTNHMFVANGCAAHPDA